MKGWREFLLMPILLLGGGCGHDGRMSPGAIAGLTAGGDHACAWWSNGTVECWGAGQTTPKLVAQIASIADLLCVGGFCCALVADGTVTCWSSSGEGDPAAPAASPTRVSGISDGQDLGGYNGSACVVRNDHTVACWGVDIMGRLGNGHGGAAPADCPLLPVKGLKVAVQVTLGDYHGCAREVDGTVWCWGDNGVGQLGPGYGGSYNQPAEPVAGLADVVDLSAAEYRTLAVRRDGSVLSWGHNNSPPTVIGGVSAASKVVAGWHHQCALLIDGSVTCWGGDDRGQVGDGFVLGAGQGPSVPPTRVLGGARVVAVGDNFSCALLIDGSVECWGANDAGQLGDGTKSDRGAPRPALLGGGG